MLTRTAELEPVEADINIALRGIFSSLDDAVWGLRERLSMSFPSLSPIPIIDFDGLVETYSELVETYSEFDSHVADLFWKVMDDAKAG